METAISSQAALGLAVLALAVAGCGGAGTSASTASFHWPRPGSAPPGWTVAGIPGGAEVPVPPGWKRVAGDAGTATAVLLDHRHQFLGYLNLTPRQGDETLANWARFRIAHNEAERDRQVRPLAAATGLRFRGGQGSCVQDTYSTASGRRYVELACLVAGRSAGAVVVGASPPASWPRISPLLERAISGLVT